MVSFRLMLGISCLYLCVNMGNSGAISFTLFVLTFTLLYGIRERNVAC